MSKHTPGIWKAASNYGCKAVGPKLGPNRQSHIRELLTTAGLNDEAEDMANARLAAASPELLAACKKLIEIDCCDGYEPKREDFAKLWDALNMARAAVEKAEGTRP